MTRAELDGITATLTTTIKALSDQMAVLTAKIDNINNNNRNYNNINNLNRGGEPIPIIRVCNDNQTIDDSSPEEEVVVTKEGDGRGNHHNYRVKADIPLFYGTMGVEEFLDWEIDVDRFFNVMTSQKASRLRWLRTD